MTRASWCLWGLLGAVTAPAAWADHSPALDRFNIAVGGFRGTTTTDLSGHTRGLPQNVGGSVNFEDDLGFKQYQNVFRFKADGLIGDHQGWAVDYYSLDRSRTVGRAANVPFQGQDVAVQATAHGRMQLRLGTASYRYWFGQSQDVFGVGLGAAYYHVNLKLSGSATGTTSGPLGTANETVAGSTRYNDGAWAPELTLGYRHQFNASWRLYADAAGIRKNGGNLAGHIYSGSLGVEYDPWHSANGLQGLGFGAEYSISKVQLRRASDRYAAKLDLRTHGPALYVHYRF